MVKAAPLFIFLFVFFFFPFFSYAPCCVNHLWVEHFLAPPNTRSTGDKDSAIFDQKRIELLSCGFLAFLVSCSSEGLSIFHTRKKADEPAVKENVGR